MILTHELNASNMPYEVIRYSLVFGIRRINVHISIMLHISGIPSVVNVTNALAVRTK
jgi:hypothetical protein